MKLKNPFLTSGYAGEEYFCDRERETARMVAAFENDRNLTLIAPRRYGKTGLLHNAFAKMPREYAGVYLDIFSIGDLASFSSAFASAVTNALDTPVEKAMASRSLEETFAYLKNKRQRVVVAIDEFQQITEFPEKGVEALLRSHIQFVPHVRFVFAGSRHHHDLFRSQNEASRRLLKAVAKAGKVKEPTSGEFLSCNGFTSHSTVRSALKNLINADLLYDSDDGYIVYDRFFGAWLKRDAQ